MLKKSYKALFISLSLMLVITFAAYCANYLLNVLLAQWLGIEYYGDFAVAKNIILIIAMIILFGSNFSVNLFLPKYIEQKQWGYAHGFILKNLKTIAKSCLIFLSIGVLAVIVLLLFIQPEFKNNYIHPTLYAIWIVPPFAISLYLSELLRSFNRIYIGTIAHNLLNPILLATILGIIYLTFSSINIYQTLFVYGFALLLVILLQLIVISHVIPKNIIKQESPKYKTRNWRKTSLQILISHLIALLLFKSDLIVLEVFGHFESQVGIFSAILTIGAIYIIFLDAVVYVITPLISPAVSTHHKKRLQLILNFSNGVLICTAVIITIILYLFRISFLGHFGIDFTTGTTAYLLITIAYAIATIFGLPWYFLILSSKQKYLSIPTILTVFFNITLSSILVHFYNLDGAAISVLTTCIVVAIWQSMYVRKYLKLKPFFVV